MRCEICTIWVARKLEDHEMLVTLYLCEREKIKIRTGNENIPTWPLTLGQTRYAGHFLVTNSSYVIANIIGE